MSPFRGRRRCLAFIPAAMSAAMLGGWTSSVSASPGFLGKYDFAHPMFLQGTVVGIEPTLPRARLTVRVQAGDRPVIGNGCGRWRMRRRARR